MYVFWMDLYKINVFWADSNDDWEIGHNWENYQIFFLSLWSPKCTGIVPYNVFSFCVDIKSNMATNHCRTCLSLDLWENYSHPFFSETTISVESQICSNVSWMFLYKMNVCFVLTGNPRWPLQQIIVTHGTLYEKNLMESNLYIVRYSLWEINKSLLSKTTIKLI